MRLSLLSLPLLSLLVACSATDPLDHGAGGGGGSSQTSPIRLENSCRAIADSICGSYQACGLIGSEGLDGCRAEVVDCEDFVLAREVRAGNVAYDGAALRRCLAALTDASCEEDGWYDSFSVEADCRAAFRGLLPADAECNVGVSCASGRCGWDQCPMRCEAAGDAGAACGPGLAPCALHLGCVEGTCGALPGAGAPCAREYESDYEEYFWGRCAPGLSCDEETFVCRRPAGEGEPCLEEDWDYANGDASGFCGQPWRCVNGICVDRGGVGDPCEWSYEDCRMDLVCLGGRCSEPAGEGEPCAWDEDYDSACAPGLRCLTTGLCGTPLPTGAACTSSEYEDTDCRDWCEDGRCVEDVGPGQTCDDVGRFCGTGPCVEGVCTLDCGGWDEDY